MTTAPLLSLDHVYFDVRTREGAPRRVLHDLHYALPDAPGRGEFVALIGPSGSGKSSLLNLVAGLTQPSQGTVTFQGAVVRAPGPDRAVVFQAYNALPWLRVLDNAAFGLTLAGWKRGAREARAMELLIAVGLEEVAGAWPHQLSGGMRQRLALARALAISPRMLLADEPFGALDVHTREAMQDLLLRVWQDTSSTVFFVTHDVGEAVYLADEVMVLAPNPGRLAHVERIALPRPRTREVTRTREFQFYVESLTERLRQLGQRETPPTPPPYRA